QRQDRRRPAPGWRSRSGVARKGHQRRRRDLVHNDKLPRRRAFQRGPTCAQL
ncbi:hypothetical protein LPJ70_007448, partial [Coemansia sp. RSA 2708]